MKTVTAYLSHPIRGYNDCQQTGTGSLNVMRAVAVGQILRRNIPGLDLYIPGEHQEFVSLAYHTAEMDDAAILRVDGAILLKKDLVIYYNPERQFSAGMIYEKGVVVDVLHADDPPKILEYEFCEVTWNVINDLITLVAKLQG